MARNSLKSVLKLIDAEKEELPVEQIFLNDLRRSIEITDEKNARPGSQSYKPSGMNCIRQSYYVVTGAERDKEDTNHTLIGICESGSDRHERIQNAVLHMKDNEMEDGMFKIMATNKTAKAKYRKRRQRAKSKNCTFKQKGLTPQKHEGDVTMQPQKPQQQFNVPIDAPFLPFGDYPQPTGNVPQKYQQQPAIQQPMQQQMPFPTMQGYQTVQQQPPQMEAPPFPPFAK